MKTNLKQHLLLLAVAILLAEQASAAPVVISEVLYNPNGTDSGKEFIELYNNGETDQEISNWTIESAGTQFSTLLTLPVGTVLASKRHYLIAGSLLEGTKDLTIDFALQNGGGATDGVRLVGFQGAVIDTLLYDTPNTNNLQGEGEPAPLTAEGMSLSRAKVLDAYTDTESNIDDFSQTIPSPESSQSGTQDLDIALTVEILSSPPRVSNVTLLEDDDTDLDGIQIIPLPGGTRSVQLFAFVSDVDSHENIDYVTATLDGESTTLEKISGEGTTALFGTNLTFDYSKPAGNYTLLIDAFDLEGNTGMNTSEFSYLELLSLSTDSAQYSFQGLKAGESKALYGDLDTQTSLLPTIQNTGNVNMQLYASTTGIETGTVSSDTIALSLDNSSFVSIYSAQTNLNRILTPAELSGLNINVAIPHETPKGNYSATIRLISSA